MPVACGRDLHQHHHERGGAKDLDRRHMSLIEKMLLKDGNAKNQMPRKKKAEDDGNLARASSASTAASGSGGEKAQKK